MNTILGELGKSPKFCEFIKNIEEKISPITIWGLNDVGEAQFIGSTSEFSKKPICIITYNEIQAKQIIENLEEKISRLLSHILSDQGPIITATVSGERSPVLSTQG